jgi:hypothetical protein
MPTDPLLVKIILVSKGQSIEPELAGEILLGKRRALIR